ncbi:unnamed protein product [Kluyveromyces dobzhanskii CBS 2104]|uniref:WGS project CCBQ000000000 data, contig 00049 n=1 Tax=Kluyveromyces dobzhanskii CBS 2104 TaxID=1427455 RepID=A0A0A8L718_9SACH|nr:unnamed protein product [Kluyveromyces dobzhanskii CBS 2104]
MIGPKKSTEVVQSTSSNVAKEEDDISLDSLLEQLDDEEDQFLAQYRDQRLEELGEHMRKVKKNLQSEEYGSVNTFQDEQRLIQTTASAERCIVHFFVESFRKCQIMDAKLKSMAESHPTTRFFRISVADCPFLVEKLSLKVLPVVIAYKNGKELDRLIGFAKLGNDPNDFSKDELERWLVRTGVLPTRDTRLTILSKGNKLGQSKGNANYNDQDSDSDWE